MNIFLIQVKCAHVRFFLCFVCLPLWFILSAYSSDQSALSPPQASAMASAPSAHPALAFYYPWYNTSSWDPATMSDLPTVKYASSDGVTIDRQINWAANAGMTGFISSWWGPGDQTDTNFAQLLAHSATLENTTLYHFTSTIYFECDSPRFNDTASIIQSLHYLVDHYSNDLHFFHWQGKPVLFFWDPLGNGRTLSQWASIRSQIDPNNQMVWSTEGADTI